MERLFHFISPPSPCSYLPEERWEMEYEIVSNATPAEYFARMREGWRRFGHAMFRPVCRDCHACHSLRVGTDTFVPNRSQRRCFERNHRDIECHIGQPSVNAEKLELYDRFHAFQSDFKGWPEHAPKSFHDYAQSFVDNPFITEEWCYYLGDQLVGVGYVDALPGGLSAIYFYYDPNERDRSLGTWNVLSIIQSAKQRQLPHVYLGFFVAGCRSLEYKANFTPNEVRDPHTGEWKRFK